MGGTHTASPRVIPLGCSIRQLRIDCRIGFKLQIPSPTSREISSSKFHDAVLKNGALPLKILEEQVKEYILRKKAEL
jgi:hypothetical protein